MVKGVKMEDAEAAVQQEIDTLLNDGITDMELQKAKNKTEACPSGKVPSAQAAARLSG